MLFHAAGGHLLSDLHQALYSTFADHRFLDAAEVLQGGQEHLCMIRSAHIRHKFPQLFSQRQKDLIFIVIALADERDQL